MYYVVLGRAEFRGGRSETAGGAGWQTRWREMAARMRGKSGGQKTKTRSAWRLAGIVGAISLMGSGAGGCAVICAFQPVQYSAFERLNIMGRHTGFEPVTSGATIQCSTN